MELNFHLQKLDGSLAPLLWQKDGEEGSRKEEGLHGGNIFCPTHSRVIAIYQNRGEKLGSEETAVGRRGEARQSFSSPGRLRARTEHL